MTKLHAEVMDNEVLTAQQGRVLVMLCEGHPRKVVADRLDSAERTINTHIEEIYRRLGTHNVAATVALSIARGLVRISTLCLVYSISLAMVDVVDAEQDVRRPPSRVARVRPVRTARAGGLRWVV